MDGFANVPALNMSLVDADGNVEDYHGVLRITDDDSDIVGDIRLLTTTSTISLEAVEEWTYMEFPFPMDPGREKGSAGWGRSGGWTLRSRSRRRALGGAGALPPTPNGAPNT